MSFSNYPAPILVKIFNILGLRILKHLSPHPETNLNSGPGRKYSLAQLSGVVHLQFGFAGCMNLVIVDSVVPDAVVAVQEGPVLWVRCVVAREGAGRYQQGDDECSLGLVLRRFP